MPKRMREEVSRIPRLSRKYKTTKRRQLTRPRTIPLALANKQTVRMRYVGIGHSTVTAGTVSNYGFRINSIYDPDYTGTGHQPMYHDMYQGLYNHYLVKGAKLTMDVGIASSTRGGQATLYASPTNTPLTDPETIAEQPGCDSQRVFSDTPTNKLVKYYSKDKIFGNAQNSDLTAAFGENPTEGYFIFAAFYNAGDSCTFDWTATIDFVVEVSEPIANLGS